MKLGISQQINNGNGKLVLTADNLKFACAEIGIPDDAHTLRRAARAFDLYHSGKVEHVNNHRKPIGVGELTFKVASQYDRQEPYEVKIKQTPYLKAGGYAYCTCQDWMNYSGDQDLPDVNFWCKHSISVLLWLHKHGNGNGKRVVNECGSEQAMQLQNELNARLSSRENNGNGAQKAPFQLDLSNPFEESESYDIDQIEGRRNERAMRSTTPSTEVTWKLRNGEYVISYKGIMTLAEKHGIEYEVSLHDDTNTVIAKAINGNERISGKEVKIAGSIETASELAKRNAARQLLPLPEIKAVEYKAKLESEFDWQVAKAKCVELVGEANVSIIIHDLTQAGKLRQDNPSHYDRTEWLMIYSACQKDAVSRKASVNSQVERDPKSFDCFVPRNWSYNSVEFLLKCHEVINQFRESKKSIEANEMPACDALTRRLPQQTEVKRKLMMDKKLRTWLVEADGTKKEISCREICETFESKQNPTGGFFTADNHSIVTRLRAGIDSGADFSTVEIN